MTDGEREVMCVCVRVVTSQLPVPCFIFIVRNRNLPEIDGRKKDGRVMTEVWKFGNSVCERRVEAMEMTVRLEIEKYYSCDDSKKVL